jgi:hypothetical protein
MNTTSPRPDKVTKEQRTKAEQTRQDGLTTLLGDPEKTEVAEAKALVPQQTTAIAPITDDPLQDYLDTFTVPTVPGVSFRFNGKDAKYTLLNGDPLPLENTDTLVFLSDQVWAGWIKFNKDENTPPTRVQGLLNDGFRLPPRETLGNNDRSEWAIGLSSEVEDPWKHQIIILLQKCDDTGELYSFVATSETSRNAVTDLIQHCQRRKRSGKDDYPIVRLGVSSFERTKPPKVKVWKPHFTLVGHQKKDETPNPANASLAADLNDSIDF